MPNVTIVIERTITNTLEFELPKLPDALLNLLTGRSASIAGFSDDELRQIGETWTNALIDHADALRRAQNTDPVRP